MALTTTNKKPLMALTMINLASSMIDHCLIGARNPTVDFTLSLPVTGGAIDSKNGSFTSTGSLSV